MESNKIRVGREQLTTAETNELVSEIRRSDACSDLKDDKSPMIQELPQQSEIDVNANDN